MNVEIGADAAQFPEKEYMNGIAVAVYGSRTLAETIKKKLHIHTVCVYFTQSNGMKIIFFFIVNEKVSRNYKKVRMNL